MHPRFALLVAAVAALAVPSTVSGNVLFDQSDHHAGEYATSDDQSNVEVADDFIVPKGEVWRLGRIDLAGIRFCTSCQWFPAVNVRIYADANQLPGAVRFSSLGNPLSNEPNFYIPLQGPGPGSKFPVIVPGHYWLSVQAAGAGWGWAARSLSFGYPASLKSASCPGWGVRASCAIAPPQPDQVFSISGISEREVVLGKPFIRRTGSGFVPVTFAVPGVAEIRDKRSTASNPASGRRPRIKRRVLTVGSPGGTFLTKRLPIIPTGRTSRKLENGRKVKTRLRVTFTPEQGEAFSQTAWVNLKKKQPN